MLLLDDVRPPPIVVPATVRPGLAGKVKVHDTLLKARGGGDQVMGLRIAVSEHFLMLTKITNNYININQKLKNKYSH